MNTQDKLEQIITSLEDLKLSEIQVFTPNDNESEKIVITTARSSTHLNASAENIRLDAKKLGLAIIGIEGINTNWAIVDLAFVVIHIMLPEAREYYQLDKLFDND
jgi:ribosome-associated protein